MKPPGRAKALTSSLSTIHVPGDVSGIHVGALESVAEAVHLLDGSLHLQVVQNVALSMDSTVTSPSSSSTE